MGLLFCSGAVLLVLIASIALFLLIFLKGAATFWPRPLHTIQHEGGQLYLAEILETDTSGGVRMRTANRGLSADPDFFIFKPEEFQIIGKPEDAVWIERFENGPLHGLFRGITTPTQDRSGEESLEQFLKKVYELRSDIEGANWELGRAANREDQAAIQELRKQLEELNKEVAGYQLHVELPNGQPHDLQGREIYAAVFPNRLGFLDRLGVWFSNAWNFITQDPRDTNQSGGVWPALIGTSILVILMSVLVLPFGVMAAVYLNEYAKPSLFVNLVRISVNNLAGVPSIVYGVFGMGFLVYGVGGFLDVLLFSGELPKPTMGKANVLWASVTMSLLTLPVVIVATEEGLRACPLPWREGALAMGSTRWEMMRKVILPAARPGILTGLILAVSRAAGEVAPLILTGVVHFAEELPVDSAAPYVHLDRPFMHLGFHIYAVGFQSPNAEAVLPLVYSTAALLLTLILVLNFTAIRLRSRARRALEGH